MIPVAQRYQNNRQVIHHWPAGLPAPVVVDLSAGDPPARMESIPASGRDGHHRAAAMETLAGPAPDAAELGYRSPKMAARPSPHRRDSLPKCLHGRLHRYNDGLLYSQSDGGVPWSHPVHKRRTTHPVHLADHGLQHRTVDGHSLHRLAGCLLSTRHLASRSHGHPSLATRIDDPWVHRSGFTDNINIYLLPSFSRGIGVAKNTRDRQIRCIYKSFRKF